MRRIEVWEVDEGVPPFPADISTAQKLARECVRKNYKGC